jgi:hypothetical protein
VVIISEIIISHVLLILLQEKQTKEGGSTVDVEILYERCLIGEFGNILAFIIFSFHKHQELFLVLEFSPFSESYRPDLFIDF